MDIEAYKVAVRLSMTENISAGLLAISRKFGDTNKQAEVFQRKMEQIGKMTLAGGALTAVGLVITKGLDATIKAANDLVKAQNDFKTLNLSAQDNASVTAQAQRLSHETLGTTIAGNIRLIQDLHTAFGDLHHAIDVSPAFSKYEATVKMALGERAVDGTVNAAARALEHRGGAVVNNPAEFQKELEWMSQVQLASKGRVSPKDFLAASQSGKMAYTMMSPEFLYGKFAGLMSMNGGFQSGTAAMTYFSSIIGGHMDKKAKGFLADLGLYQEGVSKARLKLMNQAMSGMTPSERSIYMQSLGGESVLSGGLKDQYAQMAVQNPDQFAHLIVDRIRAKYGERLTIDEVLDIAKNFNRNTGNYLGQLVLNDSKLTKDAAIFRHAQDFNSGYNTYLNSPDGAASALSSAWTNLKAIMGLQLLPTITNVTLGFARFIDKVSKFAEDNPWATKIAMYSATAAAGLSLLTGGILLLGATITAARLVGSLGVVSSVATMLGGPVVWAIAAVAGAGVLIYKNWDKIKPALKEMWVEFKGIATNIWDRIKQVGSYIANWGVWTSLDNFCKKVDSGFASLFNTIIGYLNQLPGVNFLTTQERQVKSNAMSLLGDINAITGGHKAPRSKTVVALASQGNSGGNVDMATGMEGMYQGRDTPAVPPAGRQTIQVNSTVNLDGKPIAQVVTKHQTREATKAPASTSAFDSSMLMVYPGQVSKASTQ